MKKNLYHLWNRLEKALVLNADSPEQRRRRATLIVISSFSVITGIIAGTNTWLTSGNTIHILIPYSFSLVVATAILAYFINGKFPVLLYTFLFMTLCTPVIYHWSLGGFTFPSTPMFWPILAPIGALMFLDVKKAMWWFAAYLILLAIALFIDDQFTFLASPLSHREVVVGYGINLVGFSVTIFLTMTYFVNAFAKQYARAEGLLAELRQTNNTLEMTLDELQRTQSELVQSEKTAALGKLVSGVVHELNTPVGAINSATDISVRSVDKIVEVLDTSHIPDEIRSSRQLQAAVEALRNSGPVAVAASNRITKIVNSLKSFTRLDEATFQRVDLHEGLDSTLNLIEHELRERIRVVKEYGELPPLACNPGELNQVFLALLTNAAEAIQDRGTITIRTSTEEGNILVRVMDTGVGLSPERIQGIFDPSFKKVGSRVRAGMGLFVSHNIVQKHRGQIRVESKPGKGSTFTVMLPIH
jgi:signal transduction histidine kinase